MIYGRDNKVGIVAGEEFQMVVLSDFASEDGYR
jgi:hypothetical protein